MCNRFIALLIIFLIQIPVFCQNSKNQYLIINIKKSVDNKQVKNVSILGKNLTYIPLETTSQSLIQKIYKVVVGNSSILIKELTRLLLFDRNGHFIRQIGTIGNGPGEYNFIEDFCIDEKDNSIYIIASKRRLLVYNFDGKLKNSIALNFDAAQILIKENELMFHLANIPGMENPSWIITDKNGIAKTSIKNGLVRKNQPGMVVDKTPFYYYKNRINLMEFGIDTLYYLDKSSRKPYVLFQFEDLKMDPDLKITADMLKKPGNKLWIESIIENDSYMFIVLYIGMTNSYRKVFLEKKKNELIFLKNDAFRDDINGGPDFWPKTMTEDNSLVSFIDAYDLFQTKPGALKTTESPVLRKLKASLNESSNPVIVLLN